MSKLHWWQSAVFYQIYPRSFADGNGDGIGDFQGIIERLDYVKELGVNAIWLSPHYPSPLFDCGYDVADYAGVAPEYGTLADFQRFLGEAHRRDIRVILDLVLNHTSDQHAWFKESRSSCDNPKRDWYIWRDGAPGGGPPNNWLSTFGGSAWELDPATGQYYYHFFFKEQPDLNWRNPELKQAMWDAVRFWLDRGVDGYRLDAIGTIYEDPSLADYSGGISEAEFVEALSGVTGAKERERYWEKREEIMKERQLDQPGLHELMHELRKVVDEYPGRVLVGETEELSYCGTGADDELQMVFNFPLMRTPRFTPAWVRENQERRLAECPAGVWPCNTLGNHDSSRLISHYGDGIHDREWNRVLAALMLTLRGTPFLYYGEEIGMADLPLDDVGQFRDMLGVWFYDALVRVLGRTPAEALAEAAAFTRDKCRTPMQWTGGVNAGFCGLHPAAPTPGGIAEAVAVVTTAVQTWLPIHPNHAQGVNVADQEDDPGSLLNFYRRLLRARRAAPALVAGEYVSLGPVDPGDQCLAFLRTTGEQACLVVINMCAEPQTLDLAEALRRALPEQAAAGRLPTGRLLFSSETRNAAAVQNDLSALLVAPFEVYICEV